MKPRVPSHGKILGNSRQAESLRDSFRRVAVGMPARDMLTDAGHQRQAGLHPAPCDSTSRGREHWQARPEVASMWHQRPHRGAWPQSAPNVGGSPKPPSPHPHVGPKDPASHAMPPQEPRAMKRRALHCGGVCGPFLQAQTRPWSPHLSIRPTEWAPSAAEETRVGAPAKRDVKQGSAHRLPVEGA